MTLLEFITDLQSKGFTDKEVFDQAQEFKKTQTPVEEVVVEETETVKEGNSNDLPPTDADVDLENAASENTELELASGSSESVDDFNISTFQDSQRSGLTLGDLNARLKPEEENREAIKNYEKMTLVAEPEESYTEGAYDYKYNFTEDGATYYAKEKGAENWEITEPDSDSYLNIQSLFGHNSLDREKFASSQNLLKGGGDLNNLYNELKGQSSDIDNIKDEPIDPRLDYVQQIYNDQILVGKEELKDINKAATEFTVDVPEEIPEMEYDTTYAKEVPTGKMIPNPEFQSAKNIEKKALEQIATEQKIPVSDLDLTNPETAALFKQKIISIKTDELIDKQEKSNMVKFVDSLPSDFNGKAFTSWMGEFFSAVPSKGLVDAKHVWDKNSIQKDMETLQSDKAKSLGKENEEIGIFINKANTSLDLFTESFKAIQAGEYQTPTQVAAANKKLIQINEQRNQVVDLIKAQYAKLEDPERIDKIEDTEGYLNVLERNYGLMPVMINNATNSGIDMAQGIEELAFQVANLPNVIEEETADKDGKGGIEINKYNPLWQLGGKYLVNAWGDSREGATKKIEEYKKSLMGDIGESLSMDDLQSGSQFGRYLFQTVGGIAPQMATMVATGGAGVYLVTATAGGGRFRQYQAEMDASKKDTEAWKKLEPKKQEGETDEFHEDQLRIWNEKKPNEINYNASQMWGGALVSMGAEFAGSKFIALPMINRAKAFTGIGIKAGFTKEFGKKLLTGGYSYVGDVVSEGAEEVFAEGAGNLYDRMVLGKDVNIFDGWKDNFFSGVVMANGFKTPALFSPYINAAQTPGDKSNILGKQNQIKDIVNTIVQNPKMSQKTRSLLEGDMADLTVDINNDLVNTMNRYNDMPRVDIDALGNIEQQTFQLDQQIEAVKNDEGITVGKEALLDKLGNKKDELSGLKNDLIEPFVVKDAEGRIIGGKNLVSPKARTLQEGASVVADQLGGGIQRFDTTEDLLGAFASLETQGVKIDVKRDENGGIKDAVDQDYGLIARVPDGEGGFENQIIINNASSEAQGLLPADKHEVLHLAALTMDPAQKVKMGKDLYNSLKNDKNLNVSESTLDLIEQYKVDLDSGKLSEADFYEEVMAVTSDGLTDGSVSVVDVNKVKSIGQKLLETIGWSQNFDSGTGVINFLKDFNTDVLKGEGLSQNVLSQVQGNTEGDVSNVKKSKKPLSEDTKAYMEVDNDVLQQGLITEITNKGDGQFSIAQAITEKNWGLISKNLDINNEAQMLAAKEVVIDQLLGQFKGSGNGKYPVRNTSALAGFSLDPGPDGDTPSAQVQTYLAKTFKYRKPEIDIAIKERTGSSAELNTNKSEPTASSTTETEKPRSKRSPKKDKRYNEVLSNNLGSEVAPAIEAAIKADLAVAKKSNRFGDTKNIGQKLGETLGKTFGLNPKVFTDKSWNIKKGDLEGLTNLKQYLNSNAINDFKLLPDAYNDKGKSNFIPDNILNKLYVKDGKGKWKLDPTKTVADYKALLGPIEGAVYRASEATTIKGLAGLSFRGMVFETAVPDISNRISEGVKFSKKRRDAILKQAEQKPLNNKDAADIAFFQETIVEIMPQFVPAVIINSNNFASRSDKFGRGHFMKGSDRVSVLAAATINQSDFSKDQIKSVEIAIGSKAFFTTKNGVRQSIDYGSKKYLQKVEQNYAGLELILNGLAKMVQKFPATLSVVSAILDSASGNSGHFVRQAAIPRGEDAGFKKAGFKGEKEHTMPQNEAGLLMFEAIKNNTVSDLMGYLRNNYFMVGLSLDANSKLKDTSGQYGDAFNYGDIIPKDIMESILEAQKNGDMSKAKSIWGRYFNDNVNNVRGGIDSNTLSFDGKPVADIRGVGNVSRASKKNPNIKHAQSALISEQINNDLSKKDASKRIKAYESVAKLEFDAGKRNVELQGDKINPAMTIADQLTMLGTYDTAASKARDLNAPKKGISVFDFDDTLAKTKEKVKVTSIDGIATEISAAQFAENASSLEAAGATFDFSNFDNVINAKKGPLADLALKRQDKFGSKDIFVLTARPQIAAEGIKKFLDGIGLNLPLGNITGLENGTPGAKGNWVAQKAADGYNDFYFADDAYKNVQAVQEVLSQVNVDSEVQIAKASKKKTFDTVFNDIIENATGIKSEAEFSPARAQTIGEGKGKRTFFTTPSAEDFNGLLYKLLGKGKKGDAQSQFFKDNLIDPYNRAEIAVTNAKTQAANDYKVLKRNLKTLPKSLSKPTGIGGFTYSQAARVAIWTRQGMEVPGLSKRDAKELNDFVENDPEMNTFVDEMQKIQKGKPYPAPGKTWLGGTITSDVINNINKVNRAEYLQEWQQNIDIIFSEKNYSKLEAAYGPRYVEAMKDQIARMKSGSNRPIGGSRIVNNLLDWLNNSVGAVMFLNTKSAVLQTISAVNFLNWGDNNMVAAGKAFANQKQFWGDFMTLFNSPYLTERRDGLKINVSESEIADAVAESSNKPKAAISYLLNKGFIFTRIADSFAIAAGGSTFYRNRMNALIKDGMDPKAAEKQAFEDFYDIAETNQQSSNPSKISQQQASAAGRVILAFSNTPMQYNRIIKRSTQDLINGRGDWKSNVSKIVYYAGIQNLAFNALQAALFASAFEEEEEEDKQENNKAGRIANGMADSLVRGLGIQGAAVVALKDALTTIYKEANKEKGSPKFDKAIFDMFGFSPPLDAKVRKLKSAANTFSWEKENMKDKGFSLNNPAYLASAQVISGLTNIPMDRAIQKINNLRAITSNSSENWQKVALAMGWSTWDLGLPYYGVEDKVEMTPRMILKKKVETMAKETSTKDQKQLLLDLGLTKQEIKALKYEDIRIKKIIELQEKNKK